MLKHSGRLEFHPINIGQQWLVDVIDYVDDINLLTRKLKRWHAEFTNNIEDRYFIVMIQIRSLFVHSISAYDGDNGNSGRS